MILSYLLSFSDPTREISSISLYVPLIGDKEVLYEFHSKK